VKVRLITSYWASRIKLWVQIGQHLEKGDKLGRILLGSTVVSEFPGETQFLVRPGQRVIAGETLISERGIP
jgi:phosphatidylserine decarboxylase